MDDASLLSLLRDRPEEGVDALLRQYSGLVCAVVRSKLPAGRFCSTDVEGCVADTFSEFYLDLGRYDPEKGSIRGWLCVMARHNALDLLRAGSRDALPLEEDMAYSSADLAADLEERENRRLLLAAVNALGQPDREIILRKYYLGQSSREIADALDMRPGNVDVRAHRAVERLRSALREREEI